MDDGILLQMSDMLQNILTNGWIKWVPFSMSQLISLETRILSTITSPFETKFVHLYQCGHRLWTISVNKDKPNIPLVMVHGMGGGVGLWVQSYDALAKKRPVYAFDLLGFGRSSRPAELNIDAQLVEAEMIESIEEWRKAMDIDKMVLLGHSLGAFLVSSYTLKYPERVKHLFLVDPWGFPEKPKHATKNYPLLIRAVGSIVRPFNPLAFVRLAGPWGPSLIRRFRVDLKENFRELFDDDTILDYIFQCNAQRPSGESAFHTMAMSMGWAKYPMIKRVENIDPNIPISFIYGSRTWMDKECGNQTKHLRPDSRVDVEEVRGAGHHVYCAKPDAFNILMTKYLDLVDKKLDNEKPVEEVELKRSETEGDIEEFPVTQM